LDGPIFILIKLHRQKEFIHHHDWILYHLAFTPTPFFVPVVFKTRPLANRLGPRWQNGLSNLQVLAFLVGFFGIFVGFFGNFTSHFPRLGHVDQHFHNA
jgi:hypothetical protein